MGAEARMMHRLRTRGPGGVHCPCCGPIDNARAAEKRDWEREVEYADECD